MLVFSSKRWFTVRAAYDGSLAVVKGKMGSRHLGEASCFAMKLGKQWYGVGSVKVEVQRWRLGVGFMRAVLNCKTNFLFYTRF
jgi:hypothetical protein